MRIMITTSLISVVSVLSVFSAPLSDAVQGYKQDVFLNGNSTYILLTGIDDAVRGCRKDAEGNTVCPQDLGVNSTYILLTGIDDAVRGCRKDAEGNTVCPQDLGLVLFGMNS